MKLHLQYIAYSRCSHIFALARYMQIVYCQHVYFYFYILFPCIRKRLTLSWTESWTEISFENIPNTYLLTFYVRCNLVQESCFEYRKTRKSEISKLYLNSACDFHRNRWSELVKKRHRYKMQRFIHENIPYCHFLEKELWWNSQLTYIYKTPPTS